MSHSLHLMLLDVNPEVTAAVTSMAQQARTEGMDFIIHLAPDSRTILTELKGEDHAVHAILLPANDQKDAFVFLNNLRDPDVPVILLGPDASPSRNLEALRHGAQAYRNWHELEWRSFQLVVEKAIARQSWRTKHTRTTLENALEEARRSERAVRNSEALYHSLVENLVQNIFRKDLEGRFTFANSNFCMTVGKTREELLGKTDADLFPRDLAEKYREDDRRVIRSGQIIETEEEHEGKNGTRLTVRVVKTPLCDAEGIIVGMQGIFWDITEQKKAEQQLAASQERFALAVRGSTDGIWDWDIENNRVYFSTRFKQLLGYRYDEMDNRVEEWNSRLHPDDRHLAVAAFEEHLKNDTPYDVEYRLRCRDGEYRWFWARGLAVRDGQGHALRMAGSISDISAQKLAEEALQERTEDLERSNRDLEQFAYIASHDLKEPLRMVTSYVQLLERRYKDLLDESGKEFIAFAVDGAKRMKTLIDGLLAFSRVGTHTHAPEPVDSNRLLQEALSNLGLLISERQAVINAETLPRVVADKVLVVQLFQNLISNALKFCERPPNIHVSATCDKEWVTFCVSDNGIGIKPEHQERIFQIYQRLHSRTDYEGTGIGLAVCRKIVERHGGRIWIESELGEGSRFYFTLRGAPPNN